MSRRSLVRAVAPRLARRAMPSVLRAPTWPTSVPRPAAARTTGVAYESEWARRYGVRLARALVLDGVTRPLLHGLASPRIEGLDRIEGVTGPVLFAANHASHVDTPLLLSVLPPRFRHRSVVGAGADYFFDKRWKGHVWAFAINAIPIERTRPSPRSMRLAASLIEEGWSMVIFPEGGRSPDGWGQEHHPGPAYLSVKTGAPVVPVHIEGTRRILGKGDKAPRPATTTVTFGKPLRPDVAGGEDARAFARRIEAEIAALADEQATDWWTARRRAAVGATPSLTGPDVGAWRRTWALPARGRRTSSAKAKAWPRL